MIWEGVVVPRHKANVLAVRQAKELSLLQVPQPTQALRATFVLQVTSFAVQ